MLVRIMSLIETVQSSGAHKIECCVCLMDGVTLRIAVWELQHSNENSGPKL
jgi:hypothetical protein